MYLKNNYRPLRKKTEVEKEKQSKEQEITDLKSKLNESDEKLKKN